ncbi:unnamed protein product [Protopolystoma xenopodis]|uniref:Uncharacterized protein n=1 Tax=Protopolystoma xenopodis TaxID=117903 RepID=A0A448XLR4_9PLAT|nr:unnamed protein product [Protopolystoma xenopodis]
MQIRGTRCRHADWLEISRSFRPEPQSARPWRTGPVGDCFFRRRTDVRPADTLPLQRSPSPVESRWGRGELRWLLECRLCMDPSGVHGVVASRRDCSKQVPLRAEFEPRRPVSTTANCINRRAAVLWRGRFADEPACLSVWCLYGVSLSGGALCRALIRCFGALSLSPEYRSAGVSAQHWRALSRRRVELLTFLKYRLAAWRRQTHAYEVHLTRHEQHFAGLTCNGTPGIEQSDGTKVIWTEVYEPAGESHGNNSVCSNFEFNIHRKYPEKIRWVWNEAIRYCSGHHVYRILVELTMQIVGADCDGGGKKELQSTDFFEIDAPKAHVDRIRRTTNGELWQWASLILEHVLFQPCGRADGNIQGQE